MKNINKIFVISIMGLIILFFSYLLVNLNEKEIKITTDNFSTAANELINNWPGLNNPQISNKGNKVIGDILMYQWRITSNIISDEFPDYYYGFRLIRINRQNQIDWYCILEFHPVKQEICSKNIIYTPIGPINITDKNLADWPHVNKITLLRLKNMEKFVILLKKVKQQTSRLFYY